MRERAQSVATLEHFKKLESLKADTEAALELARESNDEEFLVEAGRLVKELEESVGELEFKCKMNGEFDSQNAIIEINSGAGGTESQDCQYIRNH